MKALSKSDITERDTIDAKINEKASFLKTAIETFNEAVATAWKDVEAARVEYNEALTEGNDWMSQRLADMEAYQGERSDKWQESDAGSAYQSWIDEYNAELDELELDEPSEVDEPDITESPLAQKPEKPE
jgi:DNA anti-recombination protein RmuC